MSIALKIIYTIAVLLVVLMLLLLHYTYCYYGQRCKAHTTEHVIALARRFLLLLRQLMYNGDALIEKHDKQQQFRIARFNFFLLLSNGCVRTPIPACSSPNE